jgi:hypothetical protein
VSTKSSLTIAGERIELLERTLREWRNNDWGGKLAWMVNGAPDPETGIAAAKSIVALNAKTDELLS